MMKKILASLLHRGAISWNAQARHLLVRERGAEIQLPPLMMAWRSSKVGVVKSS